MLAVHINEGPAKLFERTKRTEAAVHIDPVATGAGENPLEDEVPVLRTEKVPGAKLVEQRMGRQKMK